MAANRGQPAGLSIEATRLLFPRVCIGVSYTAFAIQGQQRNSRGIGNSESRSLRGRCSDRRNADGHRQPNRPPRAGIAGSRQPDKTQESLQYIPEKMKLPSSLQKTATMANPCTQSKAKHQVPNADQRRGTCQTSKAQGQDATFHGYEASQKPLVCCVEWTLLLQPVVRLATQLRHPYRTFSRSAARELELLCKRGFHPFKAQLQPQHVVMSKFAL